MTDPTQSEKGTVELRGWRMGPFVIEKRLSLSGALAIIVSFCAVVGSWYSFDFRLNQTNIALESQQKQIDKLTELQEKTNDTLSRLNMTIGVLNQRMDDYNVGKSGKP